MTAAALQTPTLLSPIGRGLLFGFIGVAIFAG